MKKKNLNPYPNHDYLYQETAFVIKANLKAQLDRGNQEYESQQLCYQYFKQYRTAIDIGARYGGWSRLMEQKFQKLIAFEPRQRWRFLYNLNIKMEKTTLHPYGLGSQSEITLMQGNRIIPSSPYAIEKVHVRTLDSFQITDIDFIKIDTDGYELQVLQGGKETILKSKPIICMEVIPGEMYRGEIADQYLQDLGAKPIDGHGQNIIYAW